MASCLGFVATVLYDLLRDICHVFIFLGLLKCKWYVLCLNKLLHTELEDAINRHKGRDPLKYVVILPYTGQKPENNRHMK